MHKIKELLKLLDISVNSFYYGIDGVKAYIIFNLVRFNFTRCVNYNNEKRI